MDNTDQDKSRLAEQYDKLAKRFNELFRHTVEGLGSALEIAQIGAR
ncbi:MAG: hypothetical protein Q8L49_02510 [Burkholderiaceae bacterium]|nr:hypothetical protein [Burkholderiaceae bacterium]